MLLSCHDQCSAVQSTAPSVAQYCTTLVMVLHRLSPVQECHRPRFIFRMQSDQEWETKRQQSTLGIDRKETRGPKRQQKRIVAFAENQTCAGKSRTVASLRLQGSLLKVLGRNSQGVAFERYDTFAVKRQALCISLQIFAPQLLNGI